MKRAILDMFFSLFALLRSSRIPRQAACSRDEDDPELLVLLLYVPSAGVTGMCRRHIQFMP